MTQSASPVSRFPLAPLAEAPEDIRARIEEVRDKTGFVPNVFLALLHRPDEWRAFVAYHDALMERDGGLSKAEREMIVVATSAAWHCPYCVVAHGAILRIRAKDPYVSDYLATNYRQAAVSERQLAMLDYALKLSQRPDEVGDADVELLHRVGFSDDDIWDIASITAFFSMSNRLSHAMALAPNPEFHAMGRVPRE
jgi:uncharacterized peroxidase-related enzyme